VTTSRTWRTRLAAIFLIVSSSLVATTATAVAKPPPPPLNYYNAGCGDNSNFWDSWELRDGYFYYGSEPWDSNLDTWADNTSITVKVISCAPNHR